MIKGLKIWMEVDTKGYYDGFGRSLFLEYLV